MLEKKPSQPTVEQVIHSLLKQGYPPLPVAPRQDARKYPLVKKGEEGEYCPLDEKLEPIPRFTGKNPSYLDKNGEPHIVYHRNYQNKFPSKNELDKWFSYPANGIGTLGGIGNTILLDFDWKKLKEQAELEKTFYSWLEEYPKLKTTWIEITHSGGFRVAVKVKKKPGFTNFSLTPNGNHIGEAIGKGRFTVLAPTIGISGNPYQLINLAEPVEVESLESIGIFPYKKVKEKSNVGTGAANSNVDTDPKKQEVNQNNAIGKIPLQKLLNKDCRKILDGQDIKNDRSESLTTLIRECYGWENWCQMNKILIQGNTGELAEVAGNNLGIDSERIQRILKTIENPLQCTPSVYFQGGDEPCWLTIRRIDKNIYEAKCPSAIKNSIPTTQDYSIPDFTPEADKIFTQIAFNALYTEQHWICIKGELHFWNETYYKFSPDTVEKRRIRDFCNSYPKSQSAQGRQQLSYGYATPEWVEKIYKWVKQSCSIDSNLINPAGLNCTNGVLEIRWENATPTWSLVPHNYNKHYYIYEPEFAYNPDADRQHSDRLLDCLDSSQKDIFLKTIAASLDLETVRKYKGRKVKALLLKGGGNNGKDSLREVVQLLYSQQGLTTSSVSDFEQYDKGRKFPLAKLEHSRVNWSSENSDLVELDKLQSLKKVTTGDPIDIERKGQDEYTINPKCVLLFNTNHIPNLKADSEAISSRYGILTFSKVYKDNPNLNKGELKADSRFKYDVDFLRLEVLPGFLNSVLDALVRLMANGIDYSCTEAAMDETREHSSHLYSFCKEVGLGYDSNSKLYANDIWKRLKNWYISNGTLSFQTTKSGDCENIWSEQVKRSDKNVRAVNQIISRFLELFPKANKGNDSNGVFLMGIGFYISEKTNEVDVKQWVKPEPPENADMKQWVKPEPPENKESEAVEPVLDNSPNIKTSVLITDCDRKEIIPVVSKKSAFIKKGLEVDKITSTASNYELVMDTVSPTPSPVDRNCSSPKQLSQSKLPPSTNNTDVVVNRFYKHLAHKIQPECKAIFETLSHFSHRIMGDEGSEL